MSNVICLPSAVNSPNPLSAAVDHLRGVVADAARTARGAPSFDLVTAERAVYSALHSIEAAALAEIMSAAEPEAVVIEADGVRYRRMTSASRGVYAALHGEVEVMRHLYREVGVRNGPTVDPVALRCGLIEGRYTPTAAVAIGHLAQAVPTREGDALCESMGVLPYSRSGMYDLATAVGARWEQHHVAVEEILMQDFEVPEEAVTVSLAADRISLPMEEDRELTDADRERGIRRPITVEGRMAWVACWTLHDVQGDPLWSTRYAHIPEDGRVELAAALEGDLWWLLERRPDLDVVTLADGAADVQGLLAEATAPFDVKARLTDFYHLTEHLGEAAVSVGLDAAPLHDRFVSALLSDDDAIEDIEDELLEWAAAFDDELPDGLYDADLHRESTRTAPIRLGEEGRAAHRQRPRRGHRQDHRHRPLQEVRCSVATADGPGPARPASAGDVVALETRDVASHADLRHQRCRGGRAPDGVVINAVATPPRLFEHAGEVVRVAGRDVDVVGACVVELRVVDL